MADLQEFGVVRGTPGNRNTPTHIISGKVVEGQTVLADFTGENAIVFPDVLALLTQAQQDELVGMVANTIIDMRRGA